MDALVSFLVLLTFMWFASVFVAKMAGVHNQYLKLSKRAAKAIGRPASRQVKKHQKFFWGMVVGGIVLLYILSKLSQQ
ncbi:MAG: hypothetical protein HYV68_00950 [Candidatus Taylorbacteria bacterium]|nr:hypothetical protein [Candidatus Taylorbacteria bacterium]